MCKCKYGCLHPWAFGLALGLLWALSLLAMAMAVSFANGYGAGFVHAVGTIYFGYHATFAGGLIGAFWGFIDAFVGGVILAWLYNILCSGFGSCKCTCDSEKKE